MGCRSPVVEANRQSGSPAQAQGPDLWNAIQYIATAGCQWAQLPEDFPPFTTVHYHFYRMRDSVLLNAINEVLVAWARVAEGRQPEPSAGTIDSQSAAIM